MNKITFFLISLLPKRIQYIILLKTLHIISSYFGLTLNTLLKESDSETDRINEDYLIIKLKNRQEIVQPKNDIEILEINPMDCIPPKIRGIVIYTISNNIMDAFSKKLPMPYHQGKIIRIRKANRNEQHQNQQYLN